MHKSLGAVALATAVFTMLNSIVAPAAFAMAAVGPDWATKLVLYNASNADLTCMVTLGASVTNPPPPGQTTNQQDGCPFGSVNLVKVYDLTAGTGPTPLTQYQKATQGWFKVPRGHQVQVVSDGVNPKTGQKTWCLQQFIFGFNQIPNSCADFTAPNHGGQTGFPDTTPGKTFNTTIYPALPNGSTGMEVAINLPGTVGGQVAIGPNPGNPHAIKSTLNEAVDITCIAGVNSGIVAQLIPPATGPFWTTNLGPRGGGNVVYRTPVSFRNSWVNIAGGCDDNCVDPANGLARPGIFPYGCTQCNEKPDIGPAQCGTSKPTTPKGPYLSQFCAAQNGLPWNTGCSFTRSPVVAGTQKFGGTILVTYTGPLSPPVKSCH